MNPDNSFRSIPDEETTSFRLPLTSKQSNVFYPFPSLIFSLPLLSSNLTGYNTETEYIFTTCWIHQKFNIFFKINLLQCSLKKLNKIIFYLYVFYDSSPSLNFLHTLWIYNASKTEGGGILSVSLSAWPTTQSFPEMSEIQTSYFINRSTFLYQNKYSIPLLIDSLFYQHKFSTGTRGEEF